MNKARRPCPAENPKHDRRSFDEEHSQTSVDCIVILAAHPNLQNGFPDPRSIRGENPF
jgi:hypothetical protein